MRTLLIIDKMVRICRQETQRRELEKKRQKALSSLQVVKEIVRSTNVNCVYARAHVFSHECARRKARWRRVEWKSVSSATFTVSSARSCLDYLSPSCSFLLTFLLSSLFSKLLSHIYFKTYTPLDSLAQRSISASLELYPPKTSIDQQQAKSWAFHHHLQTLSNLLRAGKDLGVFLDRYSE